jgi:photosystem II stability/assembly factor-like uncharacterized protein
MTASTASARFSLFIGAIIFSCSLSTGYGQGSRWSLQDSTGGGYVAVAAFDTLRCLAAGSVEGSGLVRLTTDGGASWSTVLTAGTPFTTVAWPAPDLCLAAGTKDTIWRSTDGGAHWSPLPFPFVFIHTMAMYDALDGMASSGRGTVHTIDGGITWTEVPGIDADMLWDDIVMVGPGAAAAAFERFYHIDVAGLVRSASFNPLRLDRLAFTDSLNGWGAADGIYVPFGEVDRIALLHTTDGGKSWVTAYTRSSPVALASLAFADREHGIAGGGSHVLLTSDGGGSWIEDADPIFREQGVISDIAYPAPGRAWVVTAGGSIIRGMLDRPAGVDVADDPAASGGRLDVWPNPSSGEVTIGYTIASRGSGRLSVVDLLGRELPHLPDPLPGARSGRLDLHDLPAGEYFVRLQSEAGTVTRSVVVVR